MGRLASWAVMFVWAAALVPAAGCESTESLGMSGADPDRERNDTADVADNGDDEPAPDDEIAEPADDLPDLPDTSDDADGTGDTDEAAEPLDDADDGAGDEPDTADTGDDATDDAGDNGEPDAGGDDDEAPPLPLFVSNGGAFAPGPLAVRNVRLPAGGPGGPPKALNMYVPDVPGRYAVVIFQHGFTNDHTYYSAILSQLAGHGFVVVAPQMYPANNPFGAPSQDVELADAVALFAWYRDNLSRVAGVAADTDAIGIAGHSRGGVISWLAAIRNPGLVKAIAGVDPVMGGGPTGGGNPPEFANVLPLTMPQLIMGMAGGGTCAPAGSNHAAFWSVTQGPAWYWVLQGAGHADMMDDECLLCTIACAAGPNRAGVRRAVGGLLAAHFRLALQGDESARAELINATDAAYPVTIDQRPAGVRP